MHCVMHKCIMVKLGGHEKFIKYVKNTYILRKQRGILISRGNNNFREIEGGNVCIEIAKIVGGNSKCVVDFGGKDDSFGNFPRSLKFCSETGGKSFCLVKFQNMSTADAMPR